MRSLAAAFVPALLVASCGLGLFSEIVAGDRHRVERRRASQRYDRIVMPGSVTIEPVRSTELFAEGGGHAIRVDGPIREAVLLNSEVSRRLPELWRIDFDPDATPTAVLAQYQLVGGGGSEGRLTLAGGEATIPVHLEPIDPRTGQAFDGAVKTEGGVTLHLDLSHVTHAGVYTGTLVVTLNRF